jgi:hypothetical protein
MATDLKYLAKHFIDNMNYDDYIAYMRRPALEDNMNPDHVYHYDLYREPPKPASVVTRMAVERAYEPADVARALGIKGFDKATAIVENGKVVVITSMVTNS